MIRYFAEAKIDNTIYAIYRYRYQKELIYEEAWNPNANAWQKTTDLTGLFVGGDSSLMEVSQSDAQNAFPNAFTVNRKG